MNPDRNKQRPRIAIILPVYGQPGLFSEALESALRQQTSIDYRIVLVNDGCPFPETHALCRSYACAHPERVFYVHRPNGGPSAARNTGVWFALDSWPSVEAIYFLDADNRIRSHLLDRAFSLLEQHPEAAWVFPDVAVFGSARCYIDMSGEFSILEMLQQNYSDTGSLVRRCVFEAGVAFDEERRVGYEDWDFWLQAVDAGFRGVHGGCLGFTYRRRPESRFRDNARDDSENRAYLRRKHGDILNMRRMNELEQEEHPRFAFYLADERTALLATDPRDNRRILSAEAFAHHLLRCAEDRPRYSLPVFTVVTTRAALDAMNETGLTPGVLWHMQSSLKKRKVPKVAFVRFECEADIEVRMAWDRVDSASHHAIRGCATMLMLRTPLLLEGLNNPADERLFSLENACPGVQVCERRVLSARIGEVKTYPHQAVQDLAAFMKEYGPKHRQSVRVTKNLHWEAGRPYRDAELVASEVFEAGQLFPAALNRERLQVAWALPISEFGGVDRVVHNLAHASRDYGWEPHLFVIGRPSGRLMREFQDTFRTITIVPEGEHDAPASLVGLLGGMDVVVNNHCALLNPVMGDLKRNGVLTFAQLHVVDLSPDGFSVGVPYWMLDYENALNGVLVISKVLERWCSAWGMPPAKLIHVPNAGSFEVSDARVKMVMLDRLQRSGSTPLRVLYIGRFDRQKGLDRLVQLTRRAKEAGLPVEWRIVGKEILADADHEGWDFGAIRPYIHPPAMTAQSLARHYVWADVMVLVSRFEGAPLTILEAQRLGCVVLSTNVGAIQELIFEGETGFLFSNDLDTPALCDAMLSRLKNLHEDRSSMQVVATRTVERSRGQTWARSFEVFARHVEALRCLKGAQ